MTFRKKLLVAALTVAFYATGLQAAEEATPAAPAAEVPAAQPSAPVIEEKAAATLRKMSEFLAKQEKFSLHAARTLDLVLDNGQKIQADSAAEVAVKRPDGLRVNRKGVAFDQSLYFNGKEFALHRSTGLFATAEAPATLDAFLDKAIDVLGVVPPGADLLYSDPYKALTEDTVEGMYVGIALIDGVRCHHLAFRNSAVDWQIWVEEGERPLPRKMAVAARDDGAPQFVAYYSKWELNPKFGEHEFTFTPPKSAVRIGIVELNAAAQAN